MDTDKLSSKQNVPIFSICSKRGSSAYRAVISACIASSRGITFITLYETKSHNVCHGV